MNKFLINEIIVKYKIYFEIFNYILFFYNRFNFLKNI